ncbi:MAG: tetratricopeptide repeat protein [Flavobacteriaceae bacterium]
MTKADREKIAEQLWRDACNLEDEGKISEAVEKYETAARMGNVEAMSNLGNLLDDEVDPPRPKEAVYWYKRAIRKGYSTAAWNMAMHYRNLGQRRWYIHWLYVAARMGNDDAPEELRKNVSSVTRA